MKPIGISMFMETSTVCDRGLVRAENQDAFLSKSERGIFLVADGMGGGQGGARASALVAEAFARADWTGDPAARLETVLGTVDKANAAIAEHARRAGYRQMGSTLALLLLGDGARGEARAVWIGDSRVYRVRDGELALLTHDHTVANELFGRFAGDGEGYSRSLPYAHVLTRALGVDARVQPEIRRFETRPDDRYLLCSDGVHDMLTDETIGELILSAATPDAGIRALAKAIRAAGAHDNFTATLVFLQDGAKKDGGDL